MGCLLAGPPPQPTDISEIKKLDAKGAPAEAQCHFLHVTVVIVLSETADVYVLWHLAGTQFIIVVFLIKIFIWKGLSRVC